MTNRSRNHQPAREDVPADLSAAHSQMLSDIEELAERHVVFADLLARNGAPPLWRRDASFTTLVRFILEQQVSLASANAAFERFETRLGGVTPEGALASTDAEMKKDGFSRQKTSYVKGLADMILAGTFDPSDLSNDPEIAHDELLTIRGIGPWTASCFLLFVAGQRDAWPTGDRALYVSMARNLQLEAVPDSTLGDGIASEWSPFRATAAKMLWHDYLGGRSYIPSDDAGFIGGTGMVLP